jgi:hypothetical protein
MKGEIKKNRKKNSSQPELTQLTCNPRYGIEITLEIENRQKLQC